MMRYTFLIKAAFLNTEGNTNVSEGSATASRYRGSRQTRSVRVGGRAGGDGGHFPVRRRASRSDPRQAAPAGGGKGGLMSRKGFQPGHTGRPRGTRNKLA